MMSSYTLPNSQPPKPVATAPTNGAFYGTNSTPTLSVGAVTDPNGDQVWYRFKACRMFNGLTTLLGTDCQYSGWQTSPSWTVPGSFLWWNDGVAWNVEYGDASKKYGGTPAFSDAASFILGRTSGSHPALAGGFNADAPDVMGVDPSNGNFRYSELDVSVAAPAMPLDAARTYNSLNYNVAGPFGAGWASSLGVRLEYSKVANATGVTITWPDGRREWHGENPGGTLASPVGNGNTFGFLSGTESLVTEPGGSTYRFERVTTTPSLDTFRLIEMKTEAGRTINVTYPAGSQKFTDVASGRSLTFTLDANNRVTAASTDSVAPHGVLTWKYYYDGSGRLTRVCNPNDNTITGECTVYTYDATGRLNRVNLPEGNIDAEVVYYTSGTYNGRVQTRKDGLGRSWGFAYSQVSVTPPGERQQRWVAQPSLTPGQRPVGIPTSPKCTTTSTSSAAFGTSTTCTGLTTGTCTTRAASGSSTSIRPAWPNNTRTTPTDTSSSSPIVAASSGGTCTPAAGSQNVGNRPSQA